MIEVKNLYFIRLSCKNINGNFWYVQRSLLKTFVHFYTGKNVLWIFFKWSFHVEVGKPRTYEILVHAIKFHIFCFKKCVKQRMVLLWKYLNKSPVLNYFCIRNLHFWIANMFLWRRFLFKKYFRIRIVI